MFAVIRTIVFCLCVLSTCCYGNEIQKIVLSDDTKKEAVMNNNVYTAKDFTALVGIKGLSKNLLENHFKLYQGYVTNTNNLLEQLKQLESSGQTGLPQYSELKRRFGWEFNGMRLHEYYFENMANTPSALSDGSALLQQIERDFGSYQTWEAQLRSMAKIRGIGWVMLCYDPRAERLFNVWIGEHDQGVPFGCVPLLVMDVWEHAFMLDYGIKRDGYIDAFVEAINWKEVQERFEIL